MSRGHSQLRFGSDTVLPDSVPNSNSQVRSHLTPLSQAPTSFFGSITRFCLDPCAEVLPWGLPRPSVPLEQEVCAHIRDVVALGLCEDTAPLSPEVWTEASASWKEAGGYRAHTHPSEGWDYFCHSLQITQQGP